MRRYQLTKLEAGDYVVPSNSGTTLFRISSYEDGRFHGLDRGPELVTRWIVRRCPFPASPAMSASDIRDLPWQEVETGFPSRKAALDSVFPPGLDDLADAISKAL